MNAGNTPNASCTASRRQAQSASTRELHERWSRLGDQLIDLEYRLWRATLPVGYAPPGRPPAPGLRLELTVAEMRELTAQLAAVRLAITETAVALHELQFGPGNAPVWLYDYVAQLRRPVFGVAEGVSRP